MIRSRSLAARCARAAPAALAALLALGLAVTARAEKADHDKPTNIVYDHANWDDLNQIYIFTGNVVLTKGTIIVRCDNLRVHQDPEGYDFAVATMDAPGRQVYFRQKREGYADQYIEGVGDRIEYNEKADEVMIFTRAVVKRLEAEVPQDEMRGDTIEYNSLTEKYHVEAGNTGQQAHAIIAPAKPAPGSPAATGSPPGSATRGASGSSAPAAPSPAGASPAPTPRAPAPGTPSSSAAPLAAPSSSASVTATTKAVDDAAKISLKPADLIETKPYD